jgi:hypothetical protein
LVFGGSHAATSPGAGPRRRHGRPAALDRAGRDSSTPQRQLSRWPSSQALVDQCFRSSSLPGLAAAPS